MWGKSFNGGYATSSKRQRLANFSENPKPEEKNSLQDKQKSTIRDWNHENKQTQNNAISSDKVDDNINSQSNKTHQIKIRFFCFSQEQNETGNSKKKEAREDDYGDD